MSIQVGQLGLPVITSDRMMLSTGHPKLKDQHLIINTIMTTLVFLNILLLFTLFFNIATRGWIKDDFQFFVFFIYFTMANFILIPILIILKS